MSDEQHQLAVRVPIDLLERIDELVERVPKPAGATSVNRSTIVRLALEAGVEKLEQQHPAPAPAPRSKR